MDGAIQAKKFDWMLALQKLYDQKVKTFVESTFYMRKENALFTKCWSFLSIGRF